LIHRKQSVESYMAALDALSPLAILKRGYSIVQTVPTGWIVRRASDVTVGDVIHARLSEGRLLCLVKEVLSHPVS
ncbi:MAG: hypothetical protein CV090_05805, partial [Nitrospira sp. WS238]|nr:hypothetical protein [Nitrospira sp. WS238]